MKKILSITISMLIAFTITACSSNTQTPQDSPSASQQSPSAPQDSPSASPDGGASQSPDTGESTSTAPAEADAGAKNFADILNDSLAIKNYHFIVEIDSQGETMNAEVWVMDQNIKYAGQGQIIYYNQADGTMGMYMEENNQVLVMPLEETTDIDTPLTLAEDIDQSTLDKVNYKGTEQYDGKTVEVYEYANANQSTTYYIWADNGILVKMETVFDGTTSSFAFKDMTIGGVTAADFEYPAGVEILDMGDMGGLGDSGFDFSALQ